MRDLCYWQCDWTYFGNTVGIQEDASKYLYHIDAENFVKGVIDNELCLSSAGREWDIQ